MDGSAETIRSQIVQLLPRLRRFAIALTGSVSDGDDLVQDTVERALRSLHQWEAGTRLDCWMFRIAKNRFIDVRRGNRRRGEVLTDKPDEVIADHADAVHDLEARLVLKDVTRALQNLPVDQREALALVVIEGLPYRDAADVLSIPIGTLTSRIARAREALAGLVAEV